MCPVATDIIRVCAIALRIAAYQASKMAAPSTRPGLAGRATTATGRALLRVVDVDRQEAAFVK